MRGIWTRTLDQKAEEVMEIRAKTPLFCKLPHLMAYLYNLLNISQLHDGQSTSLSREAARGLLVQREPFTVYSLDRADDL